MFNKNQKKVQKQPVPSSLILLRKSKPKPHLESLYKSLRLTLCESSSRLTNFTQFSKKNNGLKLKSRLWKKLQKSDLISDTLLIQSPALELIALAAQTVERKENRKSIRWLSENYS